MEDSSKSQQNLELLSQRGMKTISFKTFSAAYNSRVFAAPYNNEDGTGIINMGTAVNRLMEKELSERLNKNDILEYNGNFQHYYDFSGTEELRNAIASFLTRHLCPENPVNSNNLVVMNGVTSCLDSLAHTLCDAGDVLITPTPVYGRIFTDFSDRSGVTVMPLHLSAKPNVGGLSFFLDHTSLESRIQELKSEGQSVRTFILLHPHNPLGDVYSHEHIRNIMNVCARHKIHFISDEIYACSVFVEGTKHNSVLAMKDIPDPQRTHVLWGFSKDFGLAGFRIGVIHTIQKDILTCLRNVGTYQCTAHIIMNAAATLINDKEWCDKFYLPTNVNRLRQAYNRCCSRLENMGVTVRKSKAGLFMWISIQAFLTSVTVEEEMKLFEELFEAGLYVVPGSKCYCQDPGWLRLIFAVSNEEIDEGLKRMEKVLKSHKKSNHEGAHLQ